MKGSAGAKGSISLEKFKSKKPLPIITNPKIMYLVVGIFAIVAIIAVAIYIQDKNIVQLASEELCKSNTRYGNLNYDNYCAEKYGTNAEACNKDQHCAMATLGEGSYDWMLGSHECCGEPKPTPGKTATRAEPCGTANSPGECMGNTPKEEESLRQGGFIVPPNRRDTSGNKIYCTWNCCLRDENNEEGTGSGQLTDMRNKLMGNYGYTLKEAEDMLNVRNGAVTSCNPKPQSSKTTTTKQNTPKPSKMYWNPLGPILNQ